MVGDELLALDQRRLQTPDQLSTRLRAGDAQQLLIARRGTIRSLTLRSKAPLPKRWQLRENPEASAAALERRRQWLSLEPAPL